MLNSAFFEQVFWGNTFRAYIIFGVILFVGLTFKRIVSKLLGKLLFKIFNSVMANSGHDDAFISFLLKPIERFLILTTLYSAINTLRHPLELTAFHYSKLVGKVKESIPVSIGECIDRLFLFFILLTIFWILLRFVDFVAYVLQYKAKTNKNRSDDQLISFLKELIKTLIVFIGFFTLLGFVFEVNVLTLITGLGIGGIAIALAAKESLENLLGSFTIFLDKPFIVGDNVKISGVEGVVEKVGFRSTNIRTSDKTIATLPNKKMIDGTLENLSLRNLRRVKFSIGLVYETNTENLKQIIEQIKSYINNRKDTGNDGTVYFESFGDSSLNIEINYYIKVIDYAPFLAIKQEINLKIMEIVMENKSDFAYPTQRSISAPAE